MDFDLSIKQLSSEPIKISMFDHNYGQNIPFALHDTLHNFSGEKNRMSLLYLIILTVQASVFDMLVHLAIHGKLWCKNIAISFVTLGTDQ